MATITTAELAADLAQLDAFLVTRSYITGWAPTQDDVAVFAVLGASVDAKNVNVFRFHKHINAFTADERKAWPAGKGSVEKPAAKAAPAAAKPAAKPAAEEEEDDDDLFASDTEEDRAREAARLAKVAAHRANKPQKEKPKARTLITFEIKPAEAETDLEKIALQVKAIQHVGIQNWGAEHKLIPVAFGISKLIMNVVVFDDDIMFEDIEELIMGIEGAEESIQSIDVASMAKV